MEYDKELETSISKAFREVERDLSLPNNSLVDDTPAQRSSRGVKRKTMVVLLDRNFKTPQENCRTTRDDLAPLEGFGPVRKKASNKKRLL